MPYEGIKCIVSSSQSGLEKHSHQSKTLWVVVEWQIEWLKNTASSLIDYLALIYTTKSIAWSKDLPYDAVVGLNSLSHLSILLSLILSVWNDPDNMHVFHWLQIPRHVIHWIATNPSHHDLRLPAPFLVMFLFIGHSLWYENMIETVKVRWLFL